MKVYIHAEMYNTLGVDKASAQLYLDRPYTPTAEDMTGVIIISVVCCAVGTSAIWVIIIYQTRKRLRPANGETPSRRKIVAHLDTKSEHSALSKDSGTGDSTKRSSEVIRIETVLTTEYQIECCEGKLVNLC
uniref:Leucine-rich repeats and immunoglobulin-like protein domains protein 3 n=1 Tax=Triatoma infestans TaxID=30076 RepID=A0A161MIN9_TRIIF